MNPYRLTIPFIALIFFSCKNHTPDTTVADPTKIVAKDTTSNGDGSNYPTKYIEHARLEGKDQVVTLTSRFAVVDGKVDEENRYTESSNYYVYINKKTGTADTLEAA